ncbi:MAG: hypothetical protein JSS81_30000 [Acidobacteria bacterium]|nr:hypothetical protein [Acidobacteriota bacterium]
MPVHQADCSIIDDRGKAFSGKNRERARSAGILPAMRLQNAPAFHLLSMSNENETPVRAFALIAGRMPALRAAFRLFSAVFRLRHRIALDAAGEFPGGEPGRVFAVAAAESLDTAASSPLHLKLYL